MDVVLDVAEVRVVDRVERYCGPCWTMSGRPTDFMKCCLLGLLAFSHGPVAIQRFIGTDANQKNYRSMLCYSLAERRDKLLELRVVAIEGKIVLTADHRRMIRQRPYPVRFPTASEGL